MTSQYAALLAGLLEFGENLLGGARSRHSHTLFRHVGVDFANLV
jgi:hypothetical protein